MIYGELPYSNLIYERRKVTGVRTVILHIVKDFLHPRTRRGLPKRLDNWQ